MILGIFDSGLGGLTVLKEILKGNIFDKIIYYGDTLRLPYGEKDRETLFELARNDISFLRSKGADEIVIACGTVSTNVLDLIKEDYDFPLNGVVDVACKEAVRSTKNNKIGVIATPATVKTKVFTSKIQKYKKVEVYEIPCKEFTPLIEAGKIDSEEMRLALSEYLFPLKERGIDTLILGCTHYPLIANEISNYLGKQVKLINSGVLLARKINNGEKREPEIEFYVSGNTDDFKSKAKQIINIKEIDYVKNI